MLTPPTDPPLPGRPWKAIAAMAENRVIGNRNQIPWHLPEDFKWVKACTLGQVIAMGRNTFESMGRPLPRRENVVISRTVKSLPGCTVLPSLDALLRHDTDEDIWIFGGAEIYRQALPFVHSLYLTVVKGHYNGDTFFPPFEDHFTLAETLHESDAFAIHHYRAKVD
jgi:dihydrofolate reductase